MYRLCAIGSLVVILWSGSAAMAVPTETLSTNYNHPGVVANVGGTGFGANEAVDLFFDTTDVVLTGTSAAGAFSAIPLTVPLATTPGVHWISAVGRHSGLFAQQKFTVSTNWAKRDFSARNQGYNFYENVISPANASALDTMWIARTGGPVWSSPAVVGGRVFVGSNDGYLYAFATTTGGLYWKAKTGAAITSSPAVGNGLVYVGSNDGYTYAFHTATGVVAWKTASGPIYSSSPVVVNGVVYIGSSDHHLYAFNATTGAVRWSFPTGGEVDTSPAVSNGMVYVVSGDGNLYAVDAVAGTQVWASNVDGVQTSVALANDMLFYADSFSTPHFYVANALNGAGIWSTALGEPFNATTAVLANGFAYIGDGSGYIYGLDIRNWNLAWEIGPLGAVVGAPAVANGVIFIGIGGTYTTDGRLYAVDLKGNVLWVGRTGGGIQSSPAVSDGVVYVGSNDGKLYAFAPNGGPNPMVRRDRPPPSIGTLRALATKE